MDAELRAWYRERLFGSLQLLGARRGEQIGRWVGRFVGILLIGTLILLAIRYRLGGFICWLLVCIFILQPIAIGLSIAIGRLLGSWVGALQERFVGRSLRTRWVLELVQYAHKGDLSATELLLELFTRPVHPILQEIASHTLRNLRNERTIRLVCRAWFQTRHPMLEEIVRQREWVASRPLELRIYTALLTGQTRQINLNDARAVPILLRACSDSNSGLAQTAFALLQQLRAPDAIDALCQAFLDSGNLYAERVIQQRDYLPRDAVRQAALLFVTQQWDRYESLDHDHTLLATAYLTGSEPLQHRIVEVARRAGRVDLLRIVSGGGSLRRRLSELQTHEWQAILETLEHSKRWHDLWQLALDAPPRWSVRILQRLTCAGWQGETLPAAERDLYRQLQSIAMALDECIPPLRPGQTLLPHRVLRTQKSVELAEFSARDDLLAVAEGTTVRFWHAHDTRPFRSIDLGKPIRGLAFHPHEPMLAVALPSALHLYRLPEFTLLVTLNASERARLPMFTPDGQALVFLQYRRRAALHRAQDGWQSGYRTLHRPFGIECLAVSPDSQSAILGTVHGTSMWRFSDSSLTPLLFRVGITSAVACSPTGEWFAAGMTDGALWIYALVQRRRLHLFQTSSQEPIGSLSWHANGELLLMGAGRQVALWHPFEPKEPLQRIELETPVQGAMFNPNGDLVAIVSGDSIFLWTSGLAHLLYQPMARFRGGDMDWVQQALRDSATPPTERRWLEYIQHLAHWHWRHDIEVDTSPRVLSVGEYDIEIEFA